MLSMFEKLTLSFFLVFLLCSSLVAQNQIAVEKFEIAQKFIEGLGFQSRLSSDEHLGKSEQFRDMSKIFKELGVSAFDQGQAESQMSVDEYQKMLLDLVREFYSLERVEVDFLQNFALEDSVNRALLKLGIDYVREDIQNDQPLAYQSPGSVNALIALNYNISLGGIEGVLGDVAPLSRSARQGSSSPFDESQSLLIDSLLEISEQDAAPEASPFETSFDLALLFLDDNQPSDALDALNEAVDAFSPDEGDSSEQLANALGVRSIVNTNLENSESAAQDFLEARELGLNLESIDGVSAEVLDQQQTLGAFREIGDIRNQQADFILFLAENDLDVSILGLNDFDFALGIVPAFLITDRLAELVPFISGDQVFSILLLHSFRLSEQDSLLLAQRALQASFTNDLLVFGQLANLFTNVVNIFSSVDDSQSIVDFTEQVQLNNQLQEDQQFVFDDLSAEDQLVLGNAFQSVAQGQIDAQTLSLNQAAEVYNRLSTAEDFGLSFDGLDLYREQLLIDFNGVLSPELRDSLLASDEIVLANGLVASTDSANFQINAFLSPRPVLEEEGTVKNIVVVDGFTNPFVNSNDQVIQVDMGEDFQGNQFDNSASSIREVDRFTSDEFQFMSWGKWEITDPNFAFVPPRVAYNVLGFQSSPDEINRRQGTVSYQGQLSGSRNSSVQTDLTGEVGLTIDFSSRNVSGNLNIRDANTNQNFAQATFDNLALNSSGINFQGGLQGSNVLGAFSRVEGQLFGPNASEAGGLWNLTASTDAGFESAFGAFAAREV